MVCNCFSLHKEQLQACLFNSYISCCSTVTYHVVQQLHTMLFNSYIPCCSTVTYHVVQQLHTMLFNNSGVAKGWFLIRKLGVSFLTFSFDSNSFSGGTISKWPYVCFFCNNPKHNNMAQCSFEKC